MIKERVSALGDVEAPVLDVSGFATRKPVERAPVEAARAAAEASNFPSREPVRRRERKIYRTGRTETFNVRASPQTIDAIYVIAERHGWQISETLEQMLASFQRECAGK